MGTLLIDKLLQTVCTQRASDLHLTVGSQPMLRLHGHMRPLATKVLEPADTSALMKSITPERCQQELQEVGGTDFGFAFGDDGAIPRRGLQAARATSAWSSGGSPTSSSRSSSWASRPSSSS